MSTQPILSEIYEEYQPKVFSYVRSKISNPTEAEDITSDIFSKVVNKISSFDSSKSTISTWIFTISRNTIIDYYRKKKLETLEFDDSYNNIPAEEPNDYDDLLDKLYQGLEKLNETQREIVILHYWHGFKHKEIALKLNLSYTNVQKICSLAIGKLREEFSINENKKQVK